MSLEIIFFFPVDDFVSVFFMCHLDKWQAEQFVFIPAFPDQNGFSLSWSFELDNPLFLENSG